MLISSQALLVPGSPEAFAHTEDYDRRWFRSNEYESNAFILAMDKKGRG